jgi:hypothetical protein
MVITAICLSVEEFQILGQRASVAVGLRDDGPANRWMSLGLGTREENGVCVCASHYGTSNGTYGLSGRRPPFSEYKQEPSKAFIHEEAQRLIQRQMNAKAQAGNKSTGVPSALTMGSPKVGRSSLNSKRNCAADMKARLLALIQEAGTERKRIENSWYLSAEDFNKTMSPSPSNLLEVTFRKSFESS